MGEALFLPAAGACHTPLVQVLGGHAPLLGPWSHFLLGLVFGSEDLATWGAGSSRRPLASGVPLARLHGTSAPQFPSVYREGSQGVAVSLRCRRLRSVPGFRDR